MTEETCGCKTCGDCPLEAGMRHLAGQWKTMLIFRLAKKPRRFTELKTTMPGISDQVLNRQLRALIDAKVIERRKVEGSHPEYHVTEFGARLKPALAVIFEWGVTALANQAAGEKQRAHVGHAKANTTWPVDPCSPAARYTSTNSRRRRSG